MTATFRADGFRDVQADNARAAAEIFADRLARRAYGRNGFCRTIRLDSWTENRKSHTFEVFIGKPVRGERGTTAGHNEWLFVHRVSA